MKAWLSLFIKKLQKQLFLPPLACQDLQDLSTKKHPLHTSAQLLTLLCPETTHMFVIQMYCQFNFRSGSLIPNYYKTYCKCTPDMTHGENSRADVVFSANTSALPRMFTSVINIYSFPVSATTVRSLIKSYLKTLCQGMEKEI